MQTNLPENAAVLERESALDAKPGFAGVAAVAHAATILRMMDAGEPEIGVNELARRIGIHKSTVSRLLATLEHFDFVKRNRDNGRFSIGMGLIALVGPIISDMDLAKLARPYIDRLAREQGETTSLGLWQGNEVIMIEQVPGSRAVTHLARAGARVPAHATAAGKMFLAFQQESQLAEFFSRGLRRYTANTLTREHEIRAQLEAARRDGFAINIEEFQMESCGVASMIHGQKGAPVAALTLAVPKHRFTETYQKELAQLLLDYAAELSRGLGCSAGRPEV